MPNVTPSCYGKQWEANAPECRGGNDPAYIDPKTGSSKRGQCKWYNQCAQATTSAKAKSQTPGVIPPQQLIQPPPAPPTVTPRLLQSPPVPPTPQVMQQPAQQAMPAQYYAPPVVPQPQRAYAPPGVPTQQAPQVMQQPAVQYYGQVPYAPPQQAAAPHMVPMNQAMQGCSTESFLMTPEPYRNDGTSHGTRLARTMFRSMAKAGALAVANYVDYIPFGALPPGE